jgi:acyl-CoA synthetase (AMP-forming)/AMP-acid ligase II
MTTLWTLWQATAARYAEKIVVIDADTGRAWTAAQLTKEAEHLATMFRGPYVPICQPNSALWIATFLAIQKIGAAAVPLDVSLPPESQRETVYRLGARPKPSICCVKLTSGTMGGFKPVLCSPKNLQADGEHIVRTMGIRRDDRNLAIIPLGHSYGLGNLVMPLLLQGTTVVCAQAFVPRQILRLIDEYKVTVLPTVPAILRALAQLEGATKPSTLRLVISAGAPLTAEVAQQFQQRFGIKIHNFYGSSETGGICYDRTGTATLKGRSVGKPLVGVKVQIRRDGRVAVNSPAGKATLPDLGEWNHYKELRLLGRVGEVANVGGKKVVPAELETALRKLPGITDVWVTVLNDKRGNNYLAAAVETKRTRIDIEQELLKTLPAWKLPKTWLIAPALFRSDRGKLHTTELRARLSVNLP